MKSRFSKISLMIVVISILALAVGGASGQDSAPAFTVYSEDPVIQHGDYHVTWDHLYTDPGAVTFYDGQFHIFRNAFNAWPGAVDIAYATSPDGQTWTAQGDGPVMTSDQVSYAGLAALASSVLVQDDGTWVLYFYTWSNIGPHPSSVIGRATASQPTGPWTADTEPVLTTGSAGSWDENQVLAPSVVRTEDGYVMYYTGLEANGVTSAMIGMATSSDGIRWTKYDDPATTDAPFAESDPVFKAGDSGAWDDLFVEQPRVQQTPDGWVMLYRAAHSIPRNHALGIATSADGLTWTRSEANPVLTPRSVTGGQGMWYTDLLYNDGTYYLYFELQRNGLIGTNIFLAKHTGDLP